MKRKVFLLVLISATYACALQMPGDSTKYTSSEGRYNVLFAGEPKLSTQETTATTGEKMTQHLAMSSSPENICMVGYFDLQPKMTFTFDKGRDGMVAAVKGTLLAETAITLSGYSGREIKVVAKLDDGKDYLFLVRYYQAGDRIYFLQFIVPQASEDASADRRAKYFGSFQIEKAR